MKRRDFFKFLGKGIGALVVTPLLPEGEAVKLEPEKEMIDQFVDYTSKLGQPISSSCISLDEHWQASGSSFCVCDDSRLFIMRWYGDSWEPLE